jgi:hypothetical protein
MPSRFSDRPVEVVALPPLPCTSPPKTPPLPPSSSAPNPIPSSAVPELHDAIQGGEGSSEMENLNAVSGDSEVRDVRAVKDGAPSAEASMLPKPEVRLHTLTL